MDDPIDLLEHYQPTTPVPPLRLAVPTKGVFAESVMGACNSCEKKDESRFWRWEESPCPDEPTPIQAVSTESRRAEPPNLAPQPFPQPIVAFQNVPAAPDPQGFGGLLQLLSNPNLFRDVTGLSENQRNALAGLQAALSTAQFFGGKAADLALQGSMRQDIDKALDKINEQHQTGAIGDEQRAQLTEAALRSMIGGGTQAAAKPMTTDEVQQLTNTAGANDAAISVNRPGGESVSVNAQPTLASLKQPLQERCGFFGPNVTVSEVDLRQAVGLATEGERQNWFDAAGNAITENQDTQFGHLVRYWLARFGDIRPSTLAALQAAAIGGTIDPTLIPGAAAGAASITTWAQTVRAALLAGIPGAAAPNLNNRVEQALLGAREGRLNQGANRAWSAVFVCSCIRQAAIQLGLEAQPAGNHVGRDVLLLGHSGHRFYVIEAYQRRFGPGDKDGTYHAFRPNERSVQVGDIIVQDRQAAAIGAVWNFNNIPALAGGREMHCDIVVEVAADNAVAIGGNLSQSARRRRYPLNGDGTLVVAREQLFTQESNTGNLPAVPVVNAAAGLDGQSTGRIFALLCPVELCAVIPGQKVDGGLVV
jgi:hypothetical protein